MEWTTQHALSAPVATVEAVLLHPDAVASVVARIPQLAEGRLVHHADLGETVVREAWFRPSVTLGGIDAGWFEWTEHTVWHRAAHRGDFHILPHLPQAIARRFRCVGAYQLRPTTRGCDRVIRGVIEVQAPLVGAQLETVIRHTIVRGLAMEGVWLEEACASAS